MKLPIYFEGHRDQLEPIFKMVTAAREELGLDERLFPERASASSGRFLSVGKNPPFLGDYFLISVDCSIAEMKRALQWVLDPEVQDSQGTLLIHQLEEIMPGIREMSPEELESEQKMREYLEG